MGASSPAILFVVIGGTVLAIIASGMIRDSYWTPCRSGLVIG